MFVILVAMALFRWTAQEPSIGPALESESNGRAAPDSINNGAVNMAQSAKRAIHLENRESRKLSRENMQLKPVKPVPPCQGWRIRGISPGEGQRDTHILRSYR